MRANVLRVRLKRVYIIRERVEKSNATYDPSF